VSASDGLQIVLREIVRIFKRASAWFENRLFTISIVFESYGDTVITRKQLQKERELQQAVGAERKEITNDATSTGATQISSSVSDENVKS
jgi:hypothetical protein